jgi:serine/threonine-protein kinase
MGNDALKKRFETSELLLQDVLMSTYSGTDLLFRRPCTIHLLRSRWAQDKALASGLMEAVRLASTVQHATLPKLQMARRLDDNFVVVTEELPRWNLSKVLENAPGGRLKERQALTVARGLARALRSLHEADILHGDLRPETVWLDDNLHPKLLWAGAANAVALYPEAKRALADEGRSFSAPELLVKPFATVASDLYGFGALLYLMLTGVPPVVGETVTEVAVKLKARPIEPPSAKGIPLSAGMEEVLRRCLAMAPEQRYASVDEALRALDALAGEGIPLADAGATPAQRDEDTSKLPKVEPAPRDSATPPRPTEQVGDRRRVRQGVISTARQDETLPPEAPLARPEPEVEEARRPSRPTNPVMQFGCAAGIMVLLALVIGLVAIKWYELSSPPEVDVPQLVGLDAEVAGQLLKAARLDSTIAATSFDEEQPPNTVLVTDPPAGARVKAGRKIVQLTVSAGPELTQAPDVSLKNEEDASSMLERAGLKTGRVVRAPTKDEVGAGLVMAQIPAPKMRAKTGAPVDLFISTGRSPSGKTSDEDAVTATVNVGLPAGQAGMHSVRVEVFDADGLHVPYQRYHNPGESFSQDISWLGEADIAVYVDDTLASHLIYRDGKLEDAEAPDES